MCVSPDGPPPDAGLDLNLSLIDQTAELSCRIVRAREGECPPDWCAQPSTHAARSSAATSAMLAGRW